MAKVNVYSIVARSGIVSLFHTEEGNAKCRRNFHNSKAPNQPLKHPQQNRHYIKRAVSARHICKSTRLSSGTTQSVCHQLVRDVNLASRLDCIRSCHGGAQATDGCNMALSMAPDLDRHFFGLVSYFS